MFWLSVINGLKLFLHWETYVLGIAYLVISYLPFIPLMFSNNEDTMFTKSGFLLMILQPVFMVFGIFVLVSSLFPIILGVGNGASWSLPWILMFRAPLFVIIILVVMAVLSFLAAMTPILGRSNSFLILILGGTVLVFLLAMVNKFDSDLGISQIDPIPGFLTILGIVVVSAITSWLGILVVAIITTGLSFLSEDLGTILMVPVGSTFGFVPVFIYGAWLGLQLTL